jgi:hypothetical protein
MSAQAERYDNPETKQKLDEARKQLERREQAEQAEDAADTLETRSEIAAEPQPDPDAPDLRETYTVAFRGHDFEFFELGDSAIKAARFSQAEGDDVEAGSQAADFVYETLGAKSVSDAVDEAYWRRYDFDDIMDLFFDLADESADLDEEQQEKIDEFRGE